MRNTALTRFAGGLLLGIMSSPAAVSAQTPAAASQNQAAPATAAAWSLGLSVSIYVLPDDPDFVQPTVTLDRGALHLEGRYYDEDLRSGSAFIGWNFERGTNVKLEITPMIGGVVGRTDGIIPAVEFGLSYRRFEWYLEGQYVIGLGESTSFLYNWSEVTIRATDWLRAGMATQRTRTFGQRDIQRGLLAGITAGKLDGTLCLFNPGSGNAYVIASLEVTF